MACPARVICPTEGLPEGGKGARFAWPPAGGEGKGFVVRFAGEARAFVNRCPHLGVELDWEPGEFFEETGLYLVCSTHGAIFEPSTGLCVAGPCRGARLEAIAVEERDGLVQLIDDPPARPNGPGPSP
ncbi:MAG: Rieske 2Fe-2S domain-containing protein [Betaproteobacteria bacterium]|nr:Rieske 2Fe-2S domain-containing protein [Betaproteobacteria bacterium]